MVFQQKTVRSLNEVTDRASSALLKVGGNVDDEKMDASTLLWAGIFCCVLISIFSTSKSVNNIIQLVAAGLFFYLGWIYHCKSYRRCGSAGRGENRWSG